MEELTGITLFSGIGGAACGMQLAGIKIIASVELDIENRPYSEECQEMSDRNFPDADFYLEEVGKVADILPGCDVLQASTVCSNFSAFSRVNGSQETLRDTQLAKDTVKAILRCNAPYFWLEQVPGYEGTRSLEIIYKCLEGEGYSIVSDCLDMADYGVPQNRKRFFLLASRAKAWGFPQPWKRQIGWKEAIAGCELIPSDLRLSQQLALMKKLDNSYDLSKGVLVQRYGGMSGNISVRRHNEPCWTLTRFAFTDGKGKARNNSINVVNLQGVWHLSMKAIARLGGFPDGFELGRFAGQGIGYSIPPRFVKQLVEPIING